MRSPLVTEHKLYWSLGNTPFEREHAYAELMGQGTTPLEQAQFTQAVLRGRPVGSAAFLETLADVHPKVAVKRPRGRPRKTPVPPESGPGECI
jgi:putative transposase